MSALIALQAVGVPEARQTLPNPGFEPILQQKSNRLQKRAIRSHVLREFYL